MQRSGNDIQFSGWDGARNAVALAFLLYDPTFVTEPLRVGVIGLGRAGARYAEALAGRQVPGACLAAVCDEALERCRPFAAPGFRSADELLSTKLASALVVATPHLSHCAISHAGLKAGLHVLVEKPFGVHKAQCERVLQFHGQLGPSRPLFGVVHNYRADVRLRRLRELLTSGALGAVRRVLWQATHWYRTDAYYTESPWRGRFESEGGGVLVNQAPHVLDTLVWLLGPVRAVRGNCRFGAFHATEVEDDVSAEIEFISGARALIVIGTGESPGTHRLELSCDGGRALLEQEALVIERNRELASSYARRASSGAPAYDVERVSGAMGAPSSVALLANFVEAVAGVAPLLAPASEALSAVELGNAILWSSLLDRRITMPLDGAEFERVWSELGGRRAVQRVVGAR